MRTATIAKTRLFSMPFIAVTLAALFTCFAAFAPAANATSASAKESTTPAGGTSAPSEGKASSEAGESPTTSPPQGAGTSTLEDEAELNGTSFATWYGPGLFGRHTACGQVLTKQTVGVANRILPCGTLVDVTYDGRHATIPVIDRGPYGSLGATWDLTEGTARLLHITESVDIETKIVGRVKNSPELGLSAETARKTQQESGATGGARA